MAEKKEISLSRSRSHSKGHSADKSPHHRRAKVSPVNQPQPEPVVNSKDLGYKIVNESSYVDPSNTGSMSSIYKRIQNLRNTLKSSSTNLEVSESQADLRQSDLPHMPKADLARKASEISPPPSLRLQPTIISREY